MEFAVHRIQITVLLCFVAAGAAAAADLPLVQPAPSAPPPSAPASVWPEGFTVGAIAGTLGFGGEVGYRFTDSLGARADLTALPFTVAFTAGGVPYSTKTSLLSGALLADFYPTGGVWRVSGGLRLNENALTLHAAPGPLTINGFTFTAAQVGTLDARVRFNAAAPYLGVGLESAALARFVVGLDLGAMYEGQSRVTASASNGGVAASSLASEEALIKKYADRLSFYPVAALTAKYKF